MDIASDYNRNLDVLTANKQGRNDDHKIKMIRTSQPAAPNDPIVVRGGFPEGLTTKLQKLLVEMTPEQAEKLLPKNYTGFAASDGGTDCAHRGRRQAGREVGIDPASPSRPFFPIISRFFFFI